MAGFFCVWIERNFQVWVQVERKFLGLCLSLLVGFAFMWFVFKFVGWVCIYVCWLGLIDGGGGWISLCLGREKISRFGFRWKENSMFKFVG